MATQALKNFDAYEARHRAELEPEHNGKVALMHDEEVVGIYGDCESAFAAGMERYRRGEFSFQEIGAEPVFVSALSLQPSALWADAPRRQQIVQYLSHQLEN